MKIFCIICCFVALLLSIMVFKVLDRWYEYIFLVLVDILSILLIAINFLSLISEVMPV